MIFLFPRCNMLVPWRVLLFPSILWFNGKMAPFGDTSNLSATRVANFSLNHGRKSIFQKIHFFSLLNLTQKKHRKNIPHHRTTKKKKTRGTMSHHRMSSWESKGIPQCDLPQGRKGPCCEIINHHIQILSNPYLANG